MSQLAEVTAPAILGLDGPYKVIRLPLANHATVNVGDTIAELECPEATVEIEAYDAGELRIVVQQGQVLRPNELIANIRTSDTQNGCSVRLTLTGSDSKVVDSLRGESSRHDFILELIAKLKDNEWRTKRR